MTTRCLHLAAFLLIAWANRALASDDVEWDLRRRLDASNDDCAHDFASFKNSMQMANNTAYATVRVCADTVIDMEEPLHATNLSRFVLACGFTNEAVSAGNCTLRPSVNFTKTSETKDHRMLKLVGNGILLHGMTFNDGIHGGAVLIEGTRGFEPMAVLNCTFRNNHVKHHGGALKVTNTGCTVMVANSTFYNNSAHGRGGAMSFLTNDVMCRSFGPFPSNRRLLRQSSHRNLISCPLRILNSTFVNNTAKVGGMTDSNYPLCQAGVVEMGNRAERFCPTMSVHKNTTIFSSIQRTTAAGENVTHSENHEYYNCLQVSNA